MWVGGGVCVCVCDVSGGYSTGEGAFIYRAHGEGEGV